MTTRRADLTLLALKSAIIRNPLIVSLDATVMVAIAQMNELHHVSDRPLADHHHEARSSCVLVVDGAKLVGMVTERDIVRLSAQHHSFHNLRLREVMLSPVVSQREANLTDLVSAVHLLQQQRLHYLPLLDDHDRIVGLLALTELLQRTVAQLEAEAVSMLDDSTTQLEQQVEQRTTEIKTRAERERLVATDYQKLQTELTKRQRIEAILRESEQRYATLIEMAPVGIFQTSAEGHCLYANERWCQIAGLMPAEAAGFGWVQGIHPDDRELVSTEWYAAVQSNRPFRLEYRFQKAAGQSTWVFGQAVAEQGIAGEIVGYVGTITDISDRKAIEKALKIQRDFNQLIAEITSRFVDLRPNDLDAEIERTLQLIGEMTQVDTSYLFTFNEEQDTVKMTHEWCKSGYPRQIALAQNISQAACPWSNMLLKQRNITHVPCVADLPPEAAIDQATWQQFHLTALLVVPLIQKSVVTGLMGFSSFSSTITWGEETIRLLRVLGQTIANAQERAQDEQRLYVSEERLRLALGATNQGLYDLNLQTGEAIVTPEYATMLGYDPASFQETNAKWLERLHPDDRGAVANTYQGYVAGKLPIYKVEFRQRTQTGEWKWILSLGKIVSWDATGQPLRMLGTHTDIGDRKQAEAERLRIEKLRLELNLLENIFDIILAGYWDWDIPNNQEYLSPGFKRMFGYEDDELPNSPESWQRLIFIEDLPRVLDCFERHVQSCGQVPYYNEIRYRHKDGSTVWVIRSGQVIEWDVAGKPLRVIGCHIDITDRKQAEVQLRNLSDRLTVAVKSGAIAIWDWNVAENTLTWDDHMYELYGITPNQFTSVYDAWASSLHPDDRPLAEAAIQQALSGEKDYDPEFRVIHPDGTIHFIKAHALVQRNEQGEPQCMIGINFDISERKKAEIKLLQTTAQLAASNRELEAFAYSVSHDLRSPLRAIDGFSKALLEDYGDQFGEEGKDYFDRIRHNVKRMGMLIDDLLRLSRVSRSEMQYSVVNLSALVQEQMHELYALEPERQVTVVITPGAIVSADATLMRVIINNLLQNAWKFTSHHATACIEFGVLPLEGQTTYYVRDDGAGFDMAYVKMLFGVFQRLHNTHEFPGTGIGLATVQRAIHRHGGRIWAEGGVEQGATVYFTVPHTSIQKGA